MGIDLELEQVRTDYRNALSDVGIEAEKALRALQRKWYRRVIARMWPSLYAPRLNPSDHNDPLGDDLAGGSRVFRYLLGVEDRLLDALAEWNRLNIAMLEQRLFMRRLSTIPVLVTGTILPLFKWAGLSVRLEPRPPGPSPPSDLVLTAAGYLLLFVFLFGFFIPLIDASSTAKETLRSARRFGALIDITKACRGRARTPTRPNQLDGTS